MAYDTYTQQGSFVSDGLAERIDLRGDVDWMWVYNETIITAGGAGTGAQFYWQRGMTAGQGFVYTKLAADDSLAADILAAGTGFTLVDTSTQALGAAIATAQVNAGPPPVVLTGNTAGLANGDTVRIYNQVGSRQLDGWDYTVSAINANVSFALEFMPAVVGGAGAGVYRRIPTIDPPFYPAHRYICAITQAANAVVTMTVDGAFEVGQSVTMVVPAAFGMVEMNNRDATITAVTPANNTITLDIDSTAFTAFAFPVTADYPFTPALVVPYGSDAVVPLIDTDVTAIHDIDQIYMQLAAGANSPAGVANDVIYWMAGRSFSDT